MDFGAILRACRSRAGLTQEELAHRLHINQSDVSKYEKDLKEPSMNLCQAWVQNTQSPEVMVAFIYGVEGLNMINQIMSTVGSTISMILIGG
ncbi:helix-turn-helix domain-containing protein [Alteribacillus sp. YIM 98480]|uniref:helix-turn-helix domain-containing protein n=1 Tax=Alteribacillus sp. YIM 98480 TaxID=2606599 RepID=UPI00131D7A25|nr:helix-turn-helix domain-containing protein [Alteribacillus sp. YIM 98480]